MRRNIELKVDFHPNQNMLLGKLESCSSDSVLIENNDGIITLQSAKDNMEYTFSLNDKLKYFYSSERLNEDGLPLAGALHGSDTFWGNDEVSIFDVVFNGLGWGLFITPEKNGQKWIIQKCGEKISLTLHGSSWQISIYKGNEPDWSRQDFPFHNLPESTPYVHHAFIRGLLDFFSGTRCSEKGIYSQKPNTNGGYCGDGIPDTYFQFLSTYQYLSPIRQSYWLSQIKWLGEHMRIDGCIPWGGCNKNAPYYHLWKREDCGLFFDGNGLWLEMIYRLWAWGGIEPDLGLVIRAADFYVHYMTEEGLVAAESKKKGCEWADLLQNGWHSSLINVLAYRAFTVTQKMLAAFDMQELADRYTRHAQRIRNALNMPLNKGGLWNGNGYVDWRDSDGTSHTHWRIDTHMLAIIFGVPTAKQEKIIWKTFNEIYFKNEPYIPAPYLLYGSWSTPTDDMLEGCRNFGCGKSSMPGRMGSSLTAALEIIGESEKAKHIFNQLVNIVNKEEALMEMYDEQGNGSGEKSYIEHALSPLLAVAFKTFK